MIDLIRNTVTQNWAALVATGAFIAACLVCVRDLLTIRKLRHEIAQLKKTAAERNSRIVAATDAEIKKYARRGPQHYLYCTPPWYVISLIRELGPLRTKLFLAWLIAGIAATVLLISPTLVTAIIATLAFAFFIYWGVRLLFDRLYLGRALDELHESINGEFRISQSA
jgi:hypothetical protein